MSSKCVGGIKSYKKSPVDEKKPSTQKEQYNIAGSKCVKKVEHVKVLTNHSLPIIENPNTCVKNYGKDGNLKSERYYDENGKAYLDIDYTDHGNPKHHPFVPHEHAIKNENGKITREPGRKISK